MSHLTLETIARLVDEAPDPLEAAHLEGCADCRCELDDMRADQAVLAALPALQPPPAQWDRIEAKLAAEGLMRLPRGHAISWRHAVLRIAAAFVIFLLGTLAGVAWVGAEDPGTIAAAEDEQPLGLRPIDDPMRSPVYAPEPPPRIARQEPRPQPSRGLRMGDATDMQLVSSLISAREPRNPEEAALLVRELEALYFQTLTRIAEAGPATESGDPFTRLAVLEGITTLTGTALGQAPADPILNGYHLAALAQREATLKLIAARSTASWF
jgi:hypothetical protein